MKKKSQVQAMETIAILMVFLILVILGFVFFMKTSSISQAGKITKNQELESIRVSQAISFLPELQCASKNIITDNCFDIFKLNAFENLPDDKYDFYYPFFYYSNITVRETYPDNTASWNLYSKIGNGTYYTTVMPILLDNATSRTKSFGLLTINYYAQS